MFHCHQCGHYVQRYGRCGGGCGTMWNEDLALELGLLEMSGGNGGASLGFDPLDDQLVVNDGPIGFEPDTGQIDLNLGGIDIPL